MKKEDIPLEHPSFHRETMLGGAGIFGFALFWVAVLGLMTHYDYQNKILSGLGVGFLYPVGILAHGLFLPSRFFRQTQLPQVQNPNGLSREGNRIPWVEVAGAQLPTVRPGFPHPGYVRRGSMRSESRGAGRSRCHSEPEFTIQREKNRMVAVTTSGV